MLCFCFQVSIATHHTSIYEYLPMYGSLFRVSLFIELYCSLLFKSCIHVAMPTGLSVDYLDQVNRCWAFVSTMHYLGDESSCLDCL